jgi:hypothetical protein
MSRGAGAIFNKRGRSATALRRAVPAAKRQVRPLCGMQALPTRSLTPTPLPDPATRVPRVTLRTAQRTQAADMMTRKFHIAPSEAM